MSVKVRQSNVCERISLMPKKIPISDNRFTLLHFGSHLMMMKSCQYPQIPNDQITHSKRKFRAKMLMGRGQLTRRDFIFPGSWFEGLRPLSWLHIRLHILLHRLHWPLARAHISQRWEQQEQHWQHIICTNYRQRFAIFFMGNDAAGAALVALLFGRGGGGARRTNCTNHFWIARAKFVSQQLAGEFWRSHMC